VAPPQAASDVVRCSAPATSRGMRLRGQSTSSDSGRTREGMCRAVMAPSSEWCVDDSRSTDAVSGPSRFVRERGRSNPSQRACCVPVGWAQAHAEARSCELPGR
jgi:hypothetical protein